jgi:rhodanese-related sulfurtransferase
MIVLAGTGSPRPCKFIGENMFPEISVTELGEKLKSDEKFILLDVRELSELERAKITDSRLEVVPMSRLGSEGVAALSESARFQEIPVYVLCHHGNRSIQVTMWLAQQGYNNVFNVSGGINAYAGKVDSSVGFY